MVNIGIIQMESAPLKVNENLLKADTYIVQTAMEGAELIVFPEMFNVGFTVDEGLMKLENPLKAPLLNGLRTRLKKTIFISSHLSMKNLKTTFSIPWLWLEMTGPFKYTGKGIQHVSRELSGKDLMNQDRGFLNPPMAGLEERSVLTLFPGKHMKALNKAA